MGAFEIVTLCISSCFFGICFTILVKSVIELYLINKDIEELWDKIEQNRKERERKEESNE